MAIFQSSRLSESISDAMQLTIDVVQASANEDVLHHQDVSHLNLVKCRSVIRAVNAPIVLGQRT